MKVRVNLDRAVERYKATQEAIKKAVAEAKEREGPPEERVSEGQGGSESKS